MNSLDQKLKDKDVTWGVGASLGIGLAAFLVPQIIIGIAIAFIAQSRGQTIEEFIGEDNIVLTFVLALSVAVISTLIVRLYMKGTNFWQRIGFRKLSPSEWGLAFPGYLVYFFLAFLANISLALLFPEVADQEQDTGFTNAAGIELWMAFVSLVILAPLYEELLFRGFVFRGLAKATSYWPAALASSALFGIAHAQLNLAIDTFLVGMVASWLVWKTNSLWPAILLHGIKNLIAYIFIFVVEV
jgi:membrane protease YdiL (CAAX protease family)